MIKIHKALKIKNRIIGEINSDREIFRRENSRRSDSVSTVDRSAVMDRLSKNVEKIVRLKAAIAIATAPISASLAGLSEMKSQVTFLKSLPVRKGVELVAVTRDTTKEYTWQAEIDQEKVDLLVSQLNADISAQQDKIDDFNAKTDVDFVE